MHIAIISSIFLSTVSALWPVPITVSEGVTTVVLDKKFTIEFNGPNGTAPSGCVDTSEKVWAAIQRTYELLNDGFVPNMLYTFEEDFEPSSQEMAASQTLCKLVITQRFMIQNNFLICSAFDVSLTPKAGEVNESYVLTIPSDDDVAIITAESSYGVLWALQSFNQLFYTHTNGQLYTAHAPVYIIDEPKFKHRGLNMDLSRHFFPKETILRIIETLSWQKFNRLHMHITDSQSWYIPKKCD
jgi:hexosaminidase